MGINIDKSTKIKAMFFDIDGTLVGVGEQQIREDTLSALQKAKEQGVLLFVATGRHHLTFANGAVFRDFEFDGYATLNGGYCFSKDKDIVKKAIEKEDMQKLISYIDSRDDIAMMFLERDQTYMNVQTPQSLEIMSRYVGTLPPLADYKRALTEDIFQIGLFGDDLGEELDRLKDCMPSCIFKAWVTGGFDIFPADSNKWVGIADVLAHFGITPKETACFGDERNDIEMLENSGYSFAMYGAPLEVQNAANEVTLPISEGGLAKAILSLL